MGLIELRGDAFYKESTLKIWGAWEDKSGANGIVNWIGEGIVAPVKSALLKIYYTRDDADRVFEGPDLLVHLTPVMTSGNDSDDIDEANITRWKIKGDTFNGEIRLADKTNGKLTATCQRFAFDCVSKRKMPSIPNKRKGFRSGSDKQVCKRHCFVIEQEGGPQVA